MTKKNDTQVGQTESPEPGDQDEVRKWTEVIQRTANWHKEQARRRNWDRILTEYAGNWAHLGQELDITLMPINLIFAYTRTEIARLYFRDPWITVNAKRIEDLGNAQIAEQLINYTWAELDLKKQVKRAVLDAILVGHGWIKVGYTSEIGVVEGQSESGEKKKEIITSEYVKSENVFAYHVPWKDVLFSPDSINPPYDSRWIAFKIVKSLQAVKGSKIYENTDDLSANANPIDENDRFTQDIYKDMQNVVLYEIWDMDNRQVITISPGHDKFLRRLDWPYKMQGYPLVMFGFNQVPGDPYPLSDIAPWEGHVVELMKMMSIMMNHLKRWNRQIFVREGFMTDVEAGKFKQGVDGAIIKYVGDSGKDFFIPPYAAVQQDIYGVWNLLMDMWRNVSGQSEVDRGARVNTQTRTATELRLTMQGGRARADEKVDTLEDQISEVARKLLSLMKQYMTIPKIVRIVGEKAVSDAFRKVVETRPSAQVPGAVTGTEMFSATRLDLPEDPDVDTVAGSTLPLNKENKLRILMDMLKVIPAMGIQPGSRASIELGREIFREIDIKSLERIMDVAEEDLKIQEEKMRQLEQTQGQSDTQKENLQLEGDRTRLESTKVQAEAGKAQAAANLMQTKLKMQQEYMKHLQKMSETFSPYNGEV